MNIANNRFLLGSVLGAFLTVFPVIYIPVIQDEVFRMTSISWEWAVVAISALTYLIGMELWKLSKHLLLGEENDEMPRLKLPRYVTTETSSSV